MSTWADQKVARQCYLDSLRVGTKKAASAEETPSNSAVNMAELDPREENREMRAQPATDTESFQVGKVEGKM